MLECNYEHFMARMFGKFFLVMEYIHYINGSLE